ncbi:hypothetical protein, partial [Pseudomonas edaphica]|uniref:hypothetical protein n=1 Tax=Pseudomonas edaphica TaxID=2006980 RepID=UPI001F359CCD
MEVLLNSWALKLLPGNKTGAQLTLDKPIRQNFLSFNFCERVCAGAGKPAPTGFNVYLPDLILVQLRVISRWVA